MRTQHSHPSFIRANLVRRVGGITAGTRYEAGDAVALAPRCIRGFAPCDPYWPNRVEPETSQYTSVEYGNTRLELFLPFVDFLAALEAAGVKLIDARHKHEALPTATAPEAAGPVGP